MPRRLSAYSRKELLLLVLGMITCFALGWYLQAGWTGTTPQHPAPPLVRETTPDSYRIDGPEAKSLVDFRLDRDREQSRQRERLQEMLTSAEPGTDWAKQLEKDLLTLERRINNEHELENLLAARGYPDSAVSVNDGSVTVVIRGKELSPEQAGLIGQWAADVTGFPVSRIRITDRN